MGCGLDVQRHDPRHASLLGCEHLFKAHLPEASSLKEWHEQIFQEFVMILLPRRRFCESDLSPHGTWRAFLGAGCLPAVFWTRNGKLLNLRVRDFPHPVHPLVGIDAKGSYRVNFGAARFLFDLRQHFSGRGGLTLNSAFAHRTPEEVPRAPASVASCPSTGIPAAHF